MFKNFTLHIATILYVVITPLQITSAQEINYRIDKVTVEDGLSNNTVRSIIQDKQGFMWFGTESGLNRYDGSHFKIYYNHPNDSNSLSTSVIKNIIKDDEENLWIITSTGGLNKFNLEYNRIDRFSFNYQLSDSLNLDIFKKSAVINQNNVLWYSYSNKGLNSFNLKSKELKLFLHQKQNINSLSSNNIRSLLVDKSGDIWIGTEEGVLNHYDTKKRKFTHYFFNTSDKPSQNQPVIWEIFEDNNNFMWLGVGDALYTLNKETGTIKLKLKNKNKEKIYISNGFVSAIIKDKLNNIWIGTDNGLYKYNWLNRKFVNLHELQNYKSILTDKNILSLYQDKLGIIWVGTGNEGLYKIYPSIKAFKTLCHKASNPFSINSGPVRSIYYDEKGYLWVGTAARGISILKNGKKIAQPNYLNNYSINGITRDSKGNYWISTESNGVYVLKNFDPTQIKNSKLISYRHNPFNSKSLSNNKVTVVYEDSKKNIWLGTNAGLDLFDPVNNQFIHPQLNLKSGNQPVSIQSNCILEDKTGAMWIGTWNGLYRFNYDTDSGEIKIRNAQLFVPAQNDANTINEKQITAICKGLNNDLWIGTYGGGLNKLSIKYDSLNAPNSYKFSNYTMSHGLPNNGILGIQSDDQNNLWISTNNGISNFIIENKQFTNYNIYDGLQSNNFFWGASYKSHKGEIFFGSLHGLNYFFPDSIKKENIVPDIVFNGLKINDKEINAGKNAAIKKPINFVEEIILDYSFETFTIEFISLHYGSARKNKYNYKLEGYNKEWVETDDHNKLATYTNLNPGNYVFKVKSSNTENLQIEQIAEIKIKVRSPFWKTWWFYGLEILLSILIIYAYIKLRERKLKRDKKKLEQVVAERTQKIKNQRDEILAQNEEIKQHNEEMQGQNDILNNYKNQLEDLVEERTENLQIALNKATESERLKTAFLENLSHEIRTPLNAVVGFSQLLESIEIDNKDMNNYINKIQFGSDSLLKIVDSIMQVSKMQVGEYKLTKTKFPLGELLQEQYINAKNTILATRTKDIEIRLITNKLEKLIIYSDKSFISLVLNNIIDNAIKFTEKGFIEIAVSSKPNKIIQFMVKDTGVGIPKKDIDFVFDKFRKGEIDKSKLYRGLGVGLAMSKSITDLLGGEIWFESEAGKGSTFYFTITL